MDIQNKGFVVWVSTALGVKPDKTLHMMLFFPMIPLAWFAFRPKWHITKVIILWSGVIFGVLTEWIQHYLPHHFLSRHSKNQGRRSVVAVILADH